MTVRVAIDAATDRLSIAADRPGQAPVERVLAGARRHAGALLGLIDQVLEAVNANRNQISQVAVADGPGSFTGLRVSFAAAKALARDGSRVTTMPSLLVRAGGVAAPGERVLAVASALRGEVYAGIWHFDLPLRIVPLFAPRAIGLKDLAALPPFDRAVGDGPASLLSTLEITDRGPPSAAVLLNLLDVPGAAIPVVDIAQFEPNYGRPAEAQAKWEREHGRPLPSPGR